MSITYSENHIYYLLATLGRFQMQTLLALPHPPVNIVSRKLFSLIWMYISEL